MDDRIIILEENYNEYFESAERAFSEKKFNVASILYFKAICVGIDIFILKKEKFVPTSHTNRFRIIQDKYPLLYNIVDKDFPFYQDSYTKKLNHETAEVLRNDARGIKKMFEK